MKATPSLLVGCLCEVTHLVLGDQPIGLHGLLPLQEDHVVQRGEGEGLRSDAARNCSGREKQAFSETNTRLGKLMDLLCQFYQEAKTP